MKAALALVAFLAVAGTVLTEFTPPLRQVEADHTVDDAAPPFLAC